MSHETRDADLRWAAAGLGGMALLLALAAAAAAAFAPFTPPPPSGPPAAASNAPRLEIRGGEDLAATQAAAVQRLRRYGWVDRAKGIAHIPVDRAMALTAARGWSDVAP